MPYLGGVVAHRNPARSKIKASCSIASSVGRFPPVCLSYPTIHREMPRSALPQLIGVCAFSGVSFQLAFAVVIRAASRMLTPRSGRQAGCLPHAARFRYGSALSRATLSSFRVCGWPGRISSERFNRTTASEAFPCRSKTRARFANTTGSNGLLSIARRK